MAVPPEQAPVAALLQALAGTPPMETHISAVFLGADTVWKLRKAVRLSFLDFSALAERQRTALREFELNSAAAPGLYRDVVPVMRRPDGALALGGEGTVVDWVVRMARVPEGDFLERRLPAGWTRALLDGLGDSVAAWHAALAPVDKDQATAMPAVAEGNVQAALAAGLPAARVQAWRAAMLAALAARAGWLRDATARGFVRRAHGDLHLGNICLWQGRPVPFDALEFDEDLATIDLGYDLAFLLMDLDVRAGRPAANRVLNRYVARTGDWDLVTGLPLFLSLRAMVRAHVEARSGRPGEAARYLDAALAYLQPAPPVVVAVGGLPGTGKSTLARRAGAGARRRARSAGAAQRRNPQTPAWREAGAAPATIGLCRAGQPRRAGRVVPRRGRDRRRRARRHRRCHFPRSRRPRRRCAGGRRRPFPRRLAAGAAAGPGSAGGFPLRRCLGCRRGGAAPRRPGR